ncbi:NF-X1-type zinc finger protein NFXL1 [Striga hermonthica]|uniref:NF-X1-type zinc finger protein NFXL1 n=1 Tax=Striga hermonthica TaxID=68872 RepID=A0A9N7MD16_STRHE|nr:NF-X1-type zinc finger protein NFXL1 [Striga hermonthica]
MSLSEQNNTRRENSSQRPRNNNYSRNNRREWVPRGSAPAPHTLVPAASADVPIQNDTGNGADPINRPVRPNVPMWNRNPGGSRGNPTRFANRRGKEREDKGKFNRDENPKTSKGANIPQLVQEIQDKLLKGSVECMICYDMVRRSAPIWSCSSCYSIFHLSCTKKWAKAPTSIDLLAEKNQGSNWRCPGCQSVQLMSAKEIRYMCFCGKRPDPPSDLYLTPHSCGEPCGKHLERVIPGSDMSSEDICPHVCVLQCHPGPCPPCKAFAPPRNCPCGKKVITTRCSDRMSVLTCGQACDKLLDCGRHRCERVCHVGPCDPCEVLVNASCFCKKKVEVVLCGDMTVKGKVEGDSGVFSCGSVCENKLDCGNHVCQEMCHPGSCGECELLPTRIKTCCCGKTNLTEDRQSCLDPIPTCSKICQKILPCGLHRCENVCHSGTCPPCHVLVAQKCRCGSTSRTVECYRTVMEEGTFTCDKPCGHKKNCGRHRCSERCCPRYNSSSGQPSAEWDPHLCSMPCEKKLRCGQHSCTSLCHSGHCPPCLETIFTDLTCACGRTSIPPPLPCGTPRPSCQHPCSVPQPCGHSSSHSCHFGYCPPCSVPIAKECVGGHVVLRNIPCGSKDIRCNKLCGKTRQCGLHACSRTCHPGPCGSSSTPDPVGTRMSCGQTCGAPRRDCRHTCTAPCHPLSPCPDTRCEFPVTISCSCGRMTAAVSCGAGGVTTDGYSNVDSFLEASIVQKLPARLEENGQKVPLSQRRLVCDDECTKMERKKVLADAFGVGQPSLDVLHFGETALVSEVISDLLRRDPKWVLAVEERCRQLVLGKSRGGLNALKVHVFCPMPKEKRDALRLIAERWKLSVSSAGWEPKRFVVAHVTPKSKAPSRILGFNKSSGPAGNMLQPPVFDPQLDMDPRLVVALFDLPRDADVSALVLRFGGECELVWLNDKNALAVFGDPARAATAMRRLDQGSVYHGAVVVVAQNSGGSVGVSSGGALKGNNPWKKVVMQDSSWKEGSSSSSWGPEDLSKSSGDASGGPNSKEKEGLGVGSGNRWSVLVSGSISRSIDGASVKTENFQNRTADDKMITGSGGLEESGLNSVVNRAGSSKDTVVDDWEQAYVD